MQRPFLQTVNKEIKKYTEADTLKGKNEDIVSLYENLKEYILSQYDDIEIVHLKYYLVFKVNNKIVASLSVLKKSLKTWINLKEGNISDPDNKIRNVSNIGHHGVGDYEFNITSDDDFYYFNSCNHILSYDLSIEGRGARLGYRFI